MDDDFSLERWLSWYAPVIRRHARNEGGMWRVDLLAVLASSKGWNPLTAGEEMTVHVHGKEYVVKRTE